MSGKRNAYRSRLRSLGAVTPSRPVRLVRKLPGEGATTGTPLPPVDRRPPGRASESLPPQCS